MCIHSLNSSDMCSPCRLEELKEIRADRDALVARVAELEAELDRRESCLSGSERDLDAAEARVRALDRLSDCKYDPEDSDMEPCFECRACMDRQSAELFNMLDTLVNDFRAGRDISQDIEDAEYLRDELAALAEKVRAALAEAGKAGE